MCLMCIYSVVLGLILGLILGLSVGLAKPGRNNNEHTVLDDNRR
jgi:hypothetical protein